MSNSEEEEIARDFICFDNYDVILVVVDATCLERNLNLLFQIFEITRNVVVCVNLLDEANRKGIQIDLDLLAHELSVPVVGTTARNSKTLKKLLDTLYNVCSNKTEISPNIITYDDLIEKSINSLIPELEIDNSYLKRWVALKLIDGDEKIVAKLFHNFNLNNANLESVIHESRSIFADINVFRDNVMSNILLRAEEICFKVCKYEKQNHNKTDRKIDKILTSKKFGIPIMIGFLGAILWLTITGANYPSALLANLFKIVQYKLYALFDFINAPIWISGILIDGMYQTLAWVVSVMLPPMAIFFPLFSFLEDLGYLPRVAFNLDNYFKKCCASGKQALTMCMGFGCNAAGVIGCRIISSPRERLIAILTNVFVPCNGRFPLLIAISTIFIGSIGIGFAHSIISTIAVLFVILLGIFMTFVISKVLSKTLLKGVPSSFTLELPPYRKPQILKVLARSLLDRTLFVLGRAVVVSAPAGIAIWLLANISFYDYTLLQYIANFLNPFAKLMGLDGYILTAFIIGMPANEIVLPIILMCYLKSKTMIDLEDTNAIGDILIKNGWTFLTALNVMLFSLLHFPCATTLLTIKKEVQNAKWTLLAFVLPTVCGITLCIITNGIYLVLQNIITN